MLEPPIDVEWPDDQTYAHMAQHISSVLKRGDGVLDLRPRAIVLGLSILSKFTILSDSRIVIGLLLDVQVLAVPVLDVRGLDLRRLDFGGSIAGSVGGDSEFSEMTTSSFTWGPPFALS